MTFRLIIDPSFEDHLGKDVEKLVDDVGDRVLANARRGVPIDTRALHDALVVDRVGKGADRRNAIGADPSFTKDTSKGKRVPKKYVKIIEKRQPFLKPALYQAQGKP